MRRAVPAEHDVSRIAPVLVSARMPITDDAGRMLSTDRAPLTKYGALYFGEKAVQRTRRAEVFGE